jgi:hypothetical protein
MNESGDYYTQLPGVPARASAVPGMAHFAGSGPAGKHCGDCEFLRYWRQRPGQWDHTLSEVSQRTYKASGCAKFKELTGKHGPTVSGTNKACKYFRQSLAER